MGSAEDLHNNLRKSAKSADLFLHFRLKGMNMCGRYFLPAFEEVDGYERTEMLLRRKERV
jgi:hypothetical protein